MDGVEPSFGGGACWKRSFDRVRFVEAVIVNSGCPSISIATVFTFAEVNNSRVTVLVTSCELLISVGTVGSATVIFSADATWSLVINRAEGTIDCVRVSFCRRSISLDAAITSVKVDNSCVISFEVVSFVGTIRSAIVMNRTEGILCGKVSTVVFVCASRR